MKKVIEKQLTTDLKLHTEEAFKETPPKCILEAFEHIVEGVKDTKLSKDFFDAYSTDIKYASRKLKLSPVQTVLLAIFVDRSEDNSILMSEIAGYTGCRTTRILRLASEIDVLENKFYLRSSRTRSMITYRVPVEVINALKNNRPYTHIEEPICNLEDFFDRFSEMANDLNNDEITHDRLLERTRENLEMIKDSYFVRTINGFGLADEERLLFIYMAHLFVENDDDHICFRDISNLYDNNKLPYWCKNELRSHASPLFRHNLIENVNEDGIARPDCFRLTEYAKTDLLSELNMEIKPKTRHNLIAPDSFSEKRLIYNASEKNQIEELSSILSADRFNVVQMRLQKAGMRSGFCCLFYGSPGTGKTETVYQIARSTGRAIMQVDVDKIKSCWVGQSEQNMKRLFNNYRNICKDSKLAPILLFNEADAVLGVRMEGATRSVDKMENAIQNIILQEMETLDGIMIATTNLTTNLDKAFERRFLYKIQFNRPTEEARAKIWQCMLPSLGDDDADRLASQFDLSGGEIENIVRKYTVNTILSGADTIDCSSIADICRNERIANNPRARIGF